jgi:hypothetical protein
MLYEQELKNANHFSFNLKILKILFLTIKLFYVIFPNDAQGSFLTFF